MGPSPLKPSPLRCITNRSKRLSQVTTLVSTLETSLSRISREVTSHLTARTTQPRTLKCSLLKLSSLTIQDRSTLDTPQCLIATLATLPASSPRSSTRSTREPVRPLKRPHNSSNLRKPLSSSSFHRSQWLSSPSPHTPHSEDSPSET